MSTVRSNSSIMFFSQESNELSNKHKLSDADKKKLEELEALKKNHDIELQNLREKFAAEEAHLTSQLEALNQSRKAAEATPLQQIATVENSIKAIREVEDTELLTLLKNKMDNSHHSHKVACFYDMANSKIKLIVYDSEIDKVSTFLHSLQIEMLSRQEFVDDEFKLDNMLIEISLSQRNQLIQALQNKEIIDIPYCRKGCFGP